MEGTTHLRVLNFDNETPSLEVRIIPYLGDVLHHTRRYSGLLEALHHLVGVMLDGPFFHQAVQLNFVVHPAYPIRKP